MLVSSQYVVAQWWTYSLGVSKLLSETKGYQFEFSCYRYAEVSSMQ